MPLPSESAWHKPLFCQRGSNAESRPVFLLVVRPTSPTRIGTERLPFHRICQISKSVHRSRGFPLRLLVGAIMQIIFWGEKAKGQMLAMRAASAITAPAMICDGQQEFCSALFREPDAIGLFYSEFMSTALLAIQEFRLAAMNNPVFVLLDRFSSEHSDIALLLNAGADDVQPVTIDARELQARLLALARRDRGLSSPVHRFCGCTFNPDNGSIVSDFGNVHLTTQESTILETLILRAGAVVTKEALMTALYQGLDEARSKIVDVYICKVRKKLFRICGDMDVIETSWGRGFRFIEEGFIPKFKQTIASATRDAG